MSLLCLLLLKCGKISVSKIIPILMLSQALSAYIVVVEGRSILHFNDQSFTAIVIQTDLTILTKCEEEI